MAPVRAGPVVVATLKFTAPLPVPLAGAAIVIHESGVVAVQAQPAAVVTTTCVAAPPPAPTDWLGGLIDAAHEPAWFTVCVWPAIVITPLREAPTFAATVKFTVPLPEPLAGAVIVIQLSPVAAVHAHPPAVVTEMAAPAPAPAPSDWLAGLIEVAHPTDCVTV